MANPRKLLIDPGVYSLLATAIENSRLDEKEAADITGIREERVKKWSKVLENKNIITRKRKGDQVQIRFSSDNKENIGSLLRKSDKERQEKNEELQEKLKELNRSVIEQKNNYDEKKEELYEAQEKISLVMEKISQDRYQEALLEHRQLEKKLGEKFEIPKEADFHHLRIRDKLIRKWGTPES